MSKSRDQRLDTDPDFIIASRYNNSLSEFLKQNPSGTSDANIARMLKITQEEVDVIYLRAIMKLRKALQTQDDDEI